MDGGRRGGVRGWRRIMAEKKEGKFVSEPNGEVEITLPAPLDVPMVKFTKRFEDELLTGDISYDQLHQYFDKLAERQNALVELVKNMILRRGV